MANFIRNVVVEGVTYAVGDKRIEGDNFAYIQIPEAITVGTNLTDLAPIQKALDSTDGAMLYVPSLNALFSPTASTSPTVRIWSSTVGDKGYQLKATLDASGVLQSAVVVEAAAEAGLIITEAEWMPVFTQYFNQDPDDFDPTGTYLITDEAKVVANKLATFDEDFGYIPPDKLQIESMFPRTMVNCVYSAFNLSTPTNPLDSFMFKTLGSYPYFSMSGNLYNIPVEFGPVMIDEIEGLIIKEVKSEESDSFTITTNDYNTIYNATQALTTEEYVTTELAKAIGNNLAKYYNSGEERWNIDHFTVTSLHDIFPLCFYTLAYGLRGIDGGNYTKLVFTSTATEYYNGDITFYYGSGGCLGMRIDDPIFTISTYDYTTLKEDTEGLTTDPYVTTELAKSIGEKLVNHFVRDGAWDIDHFTVSGSSHPSPVCFYTYSEQQLVQEAIYCVKFTTTAEDGDYNGDITVYYDTGVGSDYTCLGMRIDPKPEEFVRISKKYMEIEVDTPEKVWKVNVTGGDTLNLFSSQPPAASKIIHYPESVLFTSDNAFELKFAPNLDNGSDPYVPNAKIEISKDGLNWTQATWDETNGIRLKADMLNPELGKYSVFIKSDNHINTDDSSMFSTFSTASGSNIEVSGILEALWGGKPMIDFECFGLFICNLGITKTHNLVTPAIPLTASCYESMFEGCTALTTAPMLPATTLAADCYAGMFIDCAALTTLPALPAITLEDRCYINMFAGCTALATPPALPAITLAEACYENMFDGCTALTTTPTLPVTILAKACYENMFLNCTSLITPPLLPATTLAEECYAYMFKGCTALINTPMLPATTLAEECYISMFEGCTALTNPVTFPEITTLTGGCMVSMFKNCAGIKWATSGTPYEIKTVDGVVATSAAVSGMFIGNGGTPLPEGTGTPKLNTTYYLAV